MVMKIPERLVETITLPNGLRVEFHDFSRRVAGDRWLTGFNARIPVKVEREDFDMFDNSEHVYQKFLEENGDTIIYEVKRERNFIDETEKDAVFENLLETLKKHVLEYMGHENFASGVKRQRLVEFEERLHWYPDEN
jgi:hypothetical protein